MKDILRIHISQNLNIFFLLRWGRTYLSNDGIGDSYWGESVLVREAAEVVPVVVSANAGQNLSKKFDI